jgi:predicted glutamine amidotransferase
MANHSIKTQNVMSHVRFATAGAVQLENVHPFVREWGGRMWSFCHNGVSAIYVHIYILKYTLFYMYIAECVYCGNSVLHDAISLQCRALYCNYCVRKYCCVCALYNDVQHCSTVQCANMHAYQLVNSYVLCLCAVGHTNG